MERGVWSVQVHVADECPDDRRARAPDVALWRRRFELVKPVGEITLPKAVLPDMHRDNLAELADCPEWVDTVNIILEEDDEIK